MDEHELAREWHAITGDPSQHVRHALAIGTRMAAELNRQKAEIERLEKLAQTYKHDYI